VRDTEIVSPPVRVALLDANGAEVGFKIVQIDAAPVLPGKVQGFAALIPDPGGHGAGIGVDFAPALPAPAKPAAGHDDDEKASDARKPAGDHPPAGEAAASHGLRSATAPGADAPNTAAPIDAKPVGAVDKAHGEAVSASHHG
jgi:hypothetical protein